MVQILITNNLAPFTMQSIVEAEGAVVPELGNRNGKRKMSCDRLSRGGKSPSLGGF